MSDKRKAAEALLKEPLKLPLTTVEVDQRVAAIHDLANDYEAAHAEEDKLREGVLKAIAEGVWRDHPAALCRAVLKTSEIEFTRHCA